MIEAAFYSHLKASATVAAVCKNVYPHQMPQGGQPPAITYRREATEKTRSLSGETPYVGVFVSVDCYAESFLDAQAIADALESALTDFRGDLGSTSPAVDVDHIRLERRFDLFETDTKYHRVAMQFFIGYQ